MTMTPNRTYTFSWKKAIVVSLSVGLLVAALSVFAQAKGFTVQALWEGTVGEFAQSLKLDGQGSSFEVPDKPERLLIPAIGVDAHVQEVGLTEDGDIGIPTNFTDVAWFNKGVLPGAPGVAVIDGHVDGRDVPRAVFYDLDKLESGDEVRVIDASGRELVFKVVEKKTYDYDAPTDDIFANTAKAKLVLITCGGEWIASENVYDTRVVVFTEFVSEG